MYQDFLVSRVSRETEGTYRRSIRLLLDRDPDEFVSFARKDPDGAENYLLKRIVFQSIKRDFIIHHTHLIRISQDILHKYQL